MMKEYLLAQPSKNLSLYSMMMGLRLLVFVYAMMHCYLLHLAVAQIIDPSEVSALQAVKNRLSDPMKHLRNWKSGDPCTSNWTGVLCFDTVLNDGYLHVKALELLNMNLSGSLAPELGQLPHLQILDFMWNDLTGSIPKEIGSLSSLILLLLNGNKLSGFLPDELGYLSKLNRFQVDQNCISGPIPKSFANMSSVKHIHMNNNSFSGQIPAELSNLSSLIHLLLDNNNFSGNLPPEISKLPELRILQLDNNQFGGSEIPSIYGNFSKLAKISLRNCSLQGAVPDLSGIRGLLYLDLSQNHLTGPIPSNKLSDNMTTIDLSDNRLNGSIPANFSDLHLLQKLDLGNNQLSNISEGLHFPDNVTLRYLLYCHTVNLHCMSEDICNDSAPWLTASLQVLRGNPICIKANIPHIDRFCGNEAGEESFPTHTTNSTMSCPTEACPVENFFEYVPASPVPCFCASPLRIEYRLKSPSFVYFLPYNHSFEEYLTQTLNLDLYQLSIELFVWEKGPRLHMHIKLFPKANYVHSNTFNASEVQRIRHRFTTWDFPRNDLFGPYELLNFTLLGPYATLNAETRRTGITGGILAAIIVGAVVCVVAISATVTLLIKRRVHARNQLSLSRTHLSSSRASMKLDGVKNFKFRELAEATANFNSSNQVGRGGYGKVYKGVLSDNTVVAIKRAEEGSLQGQKEFLTEIKLLSRLHHRNLVSLVGYCDEEAEQMLVYEFMPNGTLWDWLSAKGKESLNFSMRLRIALDSARGILYLHTDANPPVFHRDIKASNILLDSKLNAKVADFGLSRLAPVMDEDGTVPTHVSTIVKGTPGYLDPEYFLTHKLTDKSDVYSFGIVLLELLTGERPISQGKNIVRQVNMAHQSGMTFSIIDTRMGSCPSECIEGLVALALSCCHDKPKHRPSMLEVVRELENIVKMVPEGDTILSQYTTPMFSSQSASSSSTMVPRGSYLLSHVSGSDLKSDVIPIIKPR